MRVILSVVVSAALATAASLGAQRPPLPPTTPRTPATPGTPAPDSENCVTTGEGRTECTFIRRAGRDSALMKRGALGMQLSTTGSIRDTLGVFVARVTPKGPAENAGIIEGDRIVSINGVDLRLSAADAGDSYTRGLPSHRLSREVAKLAPGTVANIRVYSGGRVRDVRVTAGRASDLMNNAFGSRFGGPGSNIGTYQNIPEFRENVIIPRFRMENRPRTRIETIPRMRNENSPRIRMETAPRMRILDLDRAALLEGGRRLRVLPPARTPGDRRIRIVRPPEDILIGSDAEDLNDAEDLIDREDDIVIERAGKKEVEKGAAKKKTAK